MGDNNQENVPAAPPNINNLSPQDIDIKKIADKTQAESAKKVIDSWLDSIDADITKVLTEHGVNVYQMTILHPGSKMPLMLAHGNLYAVTKLAVSTARTLKKQVDDELGI
jgi:hypothetical protein